MRKRGRVSSTASAIWTPCARRSHHQRRQPHYRRRPREDEASPWKVSCIRRWTGVTSVAAAAEHTGRMSYTMCCTAFRLEPENMWFLIKTLYRSLATLPAGSNNTHRTRWLFLPCFEFALLSKRKKMYSREVVGFSKVVGNGTND